ncbi:MULTISPECIES: alpha/beta fold hydrolase [Mycobacterium]|uniref:Haloalkane dehalogenase 2 n=1 Tax=Mycobacterium kiyosense TaxID=2871094 RepID=A0A9P3QAY7_9MYCO|nr:MULTISPECIES: alpha/beta fold hydrolase [Mycobacterium]BDB41932.1 haloalkane dehalogenase 2 [Mycobacterium kiyosense]BDE14782.1 haloalkane dehalogenase 2 [Mycobacterium sp. 20KCMC460]GLB84228.1 haloalkane dehalogenase 2 [Mycobacterium kiyosense]GLB91729.1 haloalkane dehalogenase 2 [Mycobacterium kiyosense]GLB96754.1 haloalkane dehalogenase 2 [Mycobacterium kiyosense]
MTVTDRPAWVDETLFPFQSRFVEIDGHTIHYVDEGSGPTLLFLHGNPTWSFVYRDTIRALRDEFRCVAIDYPGFGLSEAAPGYRYVPEEHAEVVAAFVDRLGLSGVTVVVHDWGGPIGLATVARNPDAFDRVVVANTWAWPVSGPHFEIFSRLMGGPLGRLLIRQFNLFVNAMIPAGHRWRKPSGTEMAHYRKALDSPERRYASAVFPRRITGSRTFLAEIEAALPGLASMPALIIWATGDIAFGDNELRRWEQVFPDHRTEIIDGAGHYVQSDAPERFAAAIRDWLA